MLSCLQNLRHRLLKSLQLSEKTVTTTVPGTAEALGKRTAAFPDKERRRSPWQELSPSQQKDPNVSSLPLTTWVLHSRINRTLSVEGVHPTDLVHWFSIRAAYQNHLVSFKTHAGTHTSYLERLGWGWGTGVFYKSSPDSVKNLISDQKSNEKKNLLYIKWTLRKKLDLSRNSSSSKNSTPFHLKNPSLY